MSSRKILSAVVLGLACNACSSFGKTTRTASLGASFTLRVGETVSFGSLAVKVSANHRPIEMAPNGVEQLPITYYKFEWAEGGETDVMQSMILGGKGTQEIPTPVFSRYTFTAALGKSEDEVILKVVKRSCLLQYTFSNQLEHPDGKIIFTEVEDLCCYYSDGKNGCDPNVTRAQNADPSEKYCVLYAKPGQTKNGCCCRYERGEKIDSRCEAICKPLLQHH